MEILGRYEAIFIQVLKLLRGTCAVVAGRGEVVSRVAELDVPDGEDVTAVAHDARPRQQRPQPDGAVL